MMTIRVTEVSRSLSALLLYPDDIYSQLFILNVWHFQYQSSDMTASFRLGSIVYADILCFVGTHQASSTEPNEQPETNQTAGVTAGATHVAGLP
jgi:hypothetical protein